MNSEQQNAHTRIHTHTCLHLAKIMEIFLLQPLYKFLDLCENGETVSLLTRSKVILKKQWKGYTGQQVQQDICLFGFFKAVQMTPLQKLQSLGTWKYRTVVPIAVT